MHDPSNASSKKRDIKHDLEDTKSQTDHPGTYCSGIQHPVNREWRKQKEKQKQKAETGETKVPPPPEKEEVRKRNNFLKRRHL